MNERYPSQQDAERDRLMGMRKEEIDEERAVLDDEIKELQQENESYVNELIPRLREELENAEEVAGDITESIRVKQEKSQLYQEVSARKAEDIARELRRQRSAQMRAAVMGGAPIRRTATPREQPIVSLPQELLEEPHDEELNFEQTEPISIESQLKKPKKSAKHETARTTGGSSRVERESFVERVGKKRIGIGAGALVLAGVVGGVVVAVQDGDGRSSNQMSEFATESIGEAFDDEGNAESREQIASMAVEANVQPFAGLPYYALSFTSERKLSGQFDVEKDSYNPENNPDGIQMRYQRISMRDSEVWGTVYPAGDEDAVAVRETDVENTYDVVIDYSKLNAELTTFDQQTDTENGQFYTTDEYTDEGGEFVKSRFEQAFDGKYKDQAGEITSELKKAMTDKPTQQNLANEALAGAAEHISTSDEVKTRLQEVAQQNVETALKEKYPEATFNFQPSTGEFANISVVADAPVEDDYRDLIGWEAEQGQDNSDKPVFTDANVKAVVTESGEE